MIVVARSPSAQARRRAGADFRPGVARRRMRPPRAARTAQRWGRHADADPGADGEFRPERPARAAEKSADHAAEDAVRARSDSVIRHAPFRLSERRAARRGRAVGADRQRGRHAVLLLFEFHHRAAFRGLPRRLRRSAGARLLRDEGQFQPGGAGDLGAARRRHGRRLRRRARRARAAGVPGDKIIFSGVGKTREEMALGLRRGHPLLQRRVRAGAGDAVRGRQRARRDGAHRHPRQSRHRRAHPRQDLDRQGGEQVRRADLARPRRLRPRPRPARPRGRRRRHAHRLADHRHAAVRRRFRAARRFRADAARRRAHDRPRRPRRRPRHPLSRRQRSAAAIPSVYAKSSRAAPATSTARSISSRAG